MLKNYSSAEIDELLSVTYGDFLYTVLCAAAVQSGVDGQTCPKAFSYAVFKLRADDYALVRRYRGVSSFKGYLAALCVDMIHDFDAGRKGGGDPVRYGAFSDNAGMRLVIKENYSIFEKARMVLDDKLSALPTEERIALRMRYEQRMNYSDVNMLLGMKNAEKKVKAVFIKLKRDIEKQVEDLSGLIP